MHYMYLHNIRSAFKNAFLPKVNCPDHIKRLDLPSNYKFEKLENDINLALDDYNEKYKLPPVPNYKELEQSEHLNRVLNPENVSNLNTENELLDKERPMVSVDQLNKLSIDELKLKMDELKDAPPMMQPQETARAMLDTELINRIDETENASNFNSETSRGLTDQIKEATNSRDEKSVSLSQIKLSTRTDSLPNSSAKRSEDHNAVIKVERKVLRRKLK